MTTYYDRNGHLIDIATYMRIASDDYRTVERTDFDRYTISTVWLGLDHSFGHAPTPLIFETMIFSDDHLDQEQARYSTEADARAGHEEMVIRCQRAISYRFGDPNQVQQP